MAHSIEIEIDEIESRKEHHLMEIKETNNIIDDMFEDLDNSYNELCTILKVNVGLSESNPDAYTPKMIFIGPYHRKNPQLDPMKKHKLLYLRRFLRRKEGLDLNNCISELHKLKEEAQKCYEEHENNYDFLTMLLLDGCFIVEFIREYYIEDSQGEASIIIDDRASYIFQDLMLLENQLPFFVVNKLYEMTKQVKESSLVILVNDLCNSCFGGMSKLTECNNVGNIKHLLHLLHIFSCSEINPRQKSINNEEITYKAMPNATELSEAGVSFAKVSGMTTTSFDINFKNGYMTIPCFQVDDSTETILRNLIAYEQQSSDVRPKYISDYAAFMDQLIDSEKDVNLLCQKGIIVNLTGDNKNVASLFNKLANGVIIMYRKFYYAEEFKQANEYSKKPWNRTKANLKHNYFSSPWVGASTVAAIILLILTTIQTILAFTGPLNK